MTINKFENFTSLEKKAISKMKGFTLIELLVVITIIGILASIVVVNLNTARGRGQDVAVKEQMSQIRAAGELYYDGNNSSGTVRYGYSDSPVASIRSGACNSTGTWSGTLFAESDFQRSVAGITRNSASIPNCYLGTGSTNAQSWAITADLRNETGYWCVDSNGNAMKITTDSAAALTDGTGVMCQ